MSTSDHNARRATALGADLHGVPLFTLYGVLFGVVVDAYAAHVYADIHDAGDGYAGSRVTAHVGVSDPVEAIRLHLAEGVAL